MSELSLRVDGKSFGGWKSVTFRRNLENLSATFSVSLTDRFSYDAEAFNFQPFQSVEVFIDSEKVFTGYIDEVQFSLDADSRTISIQGREKTLDLIDCSNLQALSQYQGIGFTEFCNTLAKPFGIKVSSDSVNAGRIPVITVNRSDSVYQLIDQAAKKLGVLVTTDRNGDLLIQSPGALRSRTALIQGENILSCSSSFDGRDRYSVYRVNGQTFNDENLEPDFFSQGEESKDLNVPRLRSLVIDQDGSSDFGSARKRAEYEASIRRARAFNFTASVYLWRQESSGALWAVNALTEVSARSVGVEGTFLIREVQFEKGERGEIATLSLVQPDAYQLKPEIKKEPKKDGLGALIRKARKP